MDINISMFMLQEKRNFKIPKTVSVRKNAQKVLKRKRKQKNGTYQGKTCQKVIQILRRNYKKKRNNKMKRREKSILKPNKERKYKIKRSGSMKSGFNSNNIYLNNIRSRKHC